MANINAHLPPAVAVPFHPPTENLQRDNLIKPVIPKTEIISSYSKMRSDENRTQFSTQAHDIIQDEGKQPTDETGEQEDSAEKKRVNFFLRRGKNVVLESDSGNTQLGALEDFKEVISVIQKRYQNAVIPFPEPSVSLAI